MTRAHIPPQLPCPRQLTWSKPYLTASIIRTPHLTKLGVDMVIVQGGCAFSLVPTINCGNGCVFEEGGALDGRTGHSHSAHQPCLRGPLAGHSPKRENISCSYTAPSIHSLDIVCRGTYQGETITLETCVSRLLRINMYWKCATLSHLPKF